MTTPSETRAAINKALDYLESGCVEPAMATLRSVRNALAASEPDMRDAYEGAREDLLDWKGRAQRAEARLRALGWTGIDASEHPAPEQPGKGEAQSIEDDVMFGWRLAQSGVCKKDAHMAAASYARKRTTQPSDPAEGDAPIDWRQTVQAAIDDIAHLHDGRARMKLELLLSTPPTAAVSVTSVCGTPIREIVKRLTAMRASTSGLSLDELITLELAEAALTAALDPQGKR